MEKIKAQLIGDWDLNDLSCSNCCKPIKKIWVQCPYCGAWFVDEKEISEMVFKLIDTIAGCILTHGRQKQALQSKTDKENRGDV